MVSRLGFASQAGLVLLLLASCDEAPKQEDYSGLVDVMNIRVQTLEDKVRELEKDRLTDQHFEAMLKPNETGYTMLGTDETMLPMELVRVIPSANGSKAVVLVGNPLNATITKLSALLKWGQTNDKGEPQEPVKELARYTFEGSFPPGQWTEKTIPLSDLPPAKVGYVRFSGAIIGSMSLDRANAPPTPQSAN